MKHCGDKQICKTLFKQTTSSKSGAFITIYVINAQDFVIFQFNKN